MGSELTSFNKIEQALNDFWPTAFEPARQLGAGPLLDYYMQQAMQPAESYPPSNVYQENDGRYVIELALAGFSKDEIEVEFNESKRLLRVKGKTKDSEEDDSRTYQSRKFAKRSFNYEATIWAGYEMGEVEYNHGQLKITVNKIPLPPEKVRKLEIK